MKIVIVTFSDFKYKNEKKKKKNFIPLEKTLNMKICLASPCIVTMRFNSVEYNIIVSLAVLLAFQIPLQVALSG